MVREILPRKSRYYSTGALNRIIDALVHPAARADIRFWILDTTFHVLNEEDLVMSAKKFASYSLPEILEQLTKQYKIKRKRR